VNLFQFAALISLSTIQYFTITVDQDISAITVSSENSSFISITGRQAEMEYALNKQGIPPTPVGKWNIAFSGVYI